MPDRQLNHDDLYEWVSVEANYRSDGTPVDITADVVRGDRHFNWDA
jgi:hypothetical protein